ncbi:MAG: 50S ribosomal protein L29 [Nitrospinae bacterium]|nr:50S ribosomal protein L29 [Nitrospinota bacterium]
MKAQDIRELSGKERGEKIDDLRQEFFNLKFQLATGKMENPSRLKHIRRDIARIKTILRETVGEESKPAEPVKEKAEKA